LITLFWTYHNIHQLSWF